MDLIVREEGKNFYNHIQRKGKRTKIKHIGSISRNGELRRRTRDHSIVNLKIKICGVKSDSMKHDLMQDNNNNKNLQNHPRRQSQTQKEKWISFWQPEEGNSEVHVHVGGAHARVSHARLRNNSRSFLFASAGDRTSGVSFLTLSIFSYD